MVRTKQLPMHQDFPRWHNSIGLGNDTSRQESRWAGVSALVKAAASSEEIEVLIRLAFRSRQEAKPNQIEKIRKAFYATDQTFEMDGNDRELQVLAAVTLAVLMMQDSNVGAKAALATTTASLEGGRKTNLPMDLSVLAKGAIDQAAGTNRKRPDLAAYKRLRAWDINFEEAVEKAQEQPDGEEFAEALRLAATAVNKAFDQMSRRHTSLANDLTRILRVQDEELQMLWWLTGRRSFDLDCTFDAVPVEARPLIFAKELSDSTEFLPGPASLKGLLSHAGLKDCTKVALPHVISAAEVTWLRTCMPEYEPSPVSMPIHYGIKRQLETGVGDAWIAGWAAAVGVDKNFAVSPLMLGLLFYCERLLIRFDHE